MTYVGRHRKSLCPRLWDVAVTVSEVTTAVTTRATIVAVTSTLVGIAAWSGDRGDPPQVEPVCVTVDPMVLTEEQVERRFLAGWYSTPDDGVERLYSPACHWTGTDEASGVSPVTPPASAGVWNEREGSLPWHA